MNHVWLACLSFLLCFQTFGEDFHVFFGTYTGAKSKGIYVSRFDSISGKLSEPELAAETKNPSFLAVHPNGKMLYAVGEVNDAQGKRAGAVNAYSLDTKTGRLVALNQQTSGGAGPCHVSVDATGKCVLVANYGSGSIAALPVRDDGALGEAATIIQHAGSSVNPQRQAGPHAHFITPSPDNRFALACDLGMDKILVYRLDSAAAKLVANDPPHAVVAHGAGPRHLAFHPNGRIVYVINEMNLTITVFGYDAARAALFEEQNISTLPTGYSTTEKDSCAEIFVHPGGRFVYGSNRGHDSIAVFSVDTKTGKLTLVQHESTQGKTPRHFAIDPGGKWLFAENQNSDSVVLFSIDTETGRLKATGQTLTVGSPVCAVFVKAN